MNHKKYKSINHEMSRMGKFRDKKTSGCVDHEMREDDWEGEVRMAYKCSWVLGRGNTLTIELVAMEVS